MKQMRLYSIDFLRLLSMVAIAHFHTHEFFFYNDQHLLRNQSFFNTLLEPYSRVMSFSGFSIVVLSFFLLGYQGLDQQKWKKLILICLVGFVVILIAGFDQSFYVEWDIYCYILSSVLILRILSWRRWVLKFSALVSLLALCLPREIYLSIPGKDLFFYNALFGDYETLGAGSWPLIPWVGLPILFYYIGLWCRENRSRLDSLHKFEPVFWFILALLTIPQLGGYYLVPIGPNFYNYTFNRGTLFLWSHIFWLIFLVRLSFIAKFNHYFLNNPYTGWISKLELNKSFFLFYIVHLLVISLFSNLADYFLSHPMWIDVFLLGLFPLTEILCKAFKMSFRLFSSNKTIGKA